jgi:4a-hydroxytetrahydrobiopterin dehydratase
MTDKLGKNERGEQVQKLNGWVLEDEEGAISRTFKFKNFSEAFGFMTRVALAAEKADHHPDWSNSYDKVTIRLSTHDAGGVSQKDFDLARAIDRLVD